jgi:hypothetical protein
MNNEQAKTVYTTLACFTSFHVMVSGWWIWRIFFRDSDSTLIRPDLRFWGTCILCFVLNQGFPSLEQQLQESRLWSKVTQLHWTVASYGIYHGAWHRFLVMLHGPYKERSCARVRYPSNARLELRS